MLHQAGTRHTISITNQFTAPGGCIEHGSSTAAANTATAPTALHGIPGRSKAGQHNHHSSVQEWGRTGEPNTSCCFRQGQRAGASSMHSYQKGPIIGEGTYGSVICATQKASGRQVAIKKVRLSSSNGKDGVNMSVLRELKALRALAAPCIVELLDTFSTKSSLVLVFEFMEWSLEDVIRDKSQLLSEADIKSYMQMVLQALAHVHEHKAIHRWGAVTMAHFCCVFAVRVVMSSAAPALAGSTSSWVSTNPSLPGYPSGPVGLQDGLCCAVLCAGNNSPAAEALRRRCAAVAGMPLQRHQARQPADLQ